MEHRIERIEAVQASGPGALDGFAAYCSCGYVLTTSLGREEALRQGAAHATYMSRKADGR
jgi:hypothetical protein